MTAPASTAPPLRILMVGELELLLTTGARFAAFRALGIGIEVEGVDLRAFLASASPHVRRLTYLTLRTPAVYAFKRAIVAAADRFRPNLLWLEKPSSCSRAGSGSCAARKARLPQYGRLVRQGPLPRDPLALSPA